MFIFLTVLFVLLGCVLLWLFLIAPRPKWRRPDCAGLVGRLYAHRGLHGKGVPENTLTAFERAAARGCGIELDVRRTKDGELVIFHDEKLERLCGQKGGVGDYTLSELQTMRLSGSAEHMPTLLEALAAVDGRVPLIVELKSMKPSAQLAAQTAQAMDGYQGAYCVESFNPFLLRWYKRHRPGITRGQLAGDMRDFAGGSALLRAMNALLKGLFVNVLSRPDFIAYRLGQDTGISCRALRALFKPLWACWTVTTPEALKASGDRYDMWIFEGFEPETTEPAD